MINYYRFFITMLHWILGDTYEPLSHFKYFPEKHKSALGKHFQQYDLLRYFAEWVVQGHVDTAGLIDQNVPLYVILYVVAKVDINSNYHVLCNCWNGVACCSYNSNKSDINHGGHTIINGGDFYTMFGRGVWGGAAHAIHNKFKS
eukprot:291302_1